MCLFTNNKSTLQLTRDEEKSRPAAMKVPQQYMLDSSREMFGFVIQYAALSHFFIYSSISDSKFKQEKMT
jgi:hypothetical protein